MTSEERRPRFSHRIEYALFRGAARISSWLGGGAASAFGEALGRLGYFPFRFRRDLVEKHLRIAFPEKDDVWIRTTMRAVYAHVGREGIMTMRMGRMSPGQIIACTTVNGMDVLRDALAQGKGVVLTSGHVGNQEVAAAALAARGVPFDIVVQRQSNPLFDAALNQARARFGLGIIDRWHSPRLATKALRKGRVVGFAADQNAGKSGIFVPFFGRLASTHRGAALFALRVGAPMVFMTAVRRGAGYDVNVELVEVDRSGGSDDVVYRLTRAFTERLEAVVRTHPEQYLWLHRRWRTRPPNSERNQSQ